MERIGPNEVRGGPNRVSAQRRRRLCRALRGALRGALCGGLREGVRGYAGVCGGVECVGTGRVAGRLRGGSVAGGECCGGGGVGGGGGSCGPAAVGWPVVEAVGCRPGRRLRGLAAGVVASGKECFGGRNAWGLPVLLRYGAADGCGGVDRKAGFLSPGRAIGMESRRGTAAERAVVMKGRGSGRGGCREPTAGIAVWMV